MQIFVFCGNFTLHCEKACVITDERFMVASPELITHPVVRLPKKLIMSQEPEDTAFAAQRKEILMKMALSKEIRLWLSKEERIKAIGNQ